MGSTLKWSAHVRFLSLAKTVAVDKRRETFVSFFYDRRLEQEGMKQLYVGRLGMTLTVTSDGQVWVDMKRNKGLPEFHFTTTTVSILTDYDRPTSVGV